MNTADKIKMKDVVGESSLSLVPDLELDLDPDLDCPP